MSAKRIYKMLRRFSLAIIILSGFAVNQVRVVANESFRTYLSQHDIIYQQPPLHPRDGFPIGNRTLAGLVYHEQGHYKVQLVKDDVWDHRSVLTEDITTGLNHQGVLDLLAKGETETLNNLTAAAARQSRCSTNSFSSASTVSHPAILGAG